MLKFVCIYIKYPGSPVDQTKWLAFEITKVSVHLDFFCVFIYHGTPKPTCLEAVMVNMLVFRWPTPLFFMVLGAHDSFLSGDMIHLLLPVEDSSGNIQP